MVEPLMFWGETLGLREPMTWLGPSAAMSECYQSSDEVGHGWGSGVVGRVYVNERGGLWADLGFAVVTAVA